MKILHVTAYEERGGAGRAARRLFEEERRQGYEVAMLVKYRESRDPGILGLSGFFAKVMASLRCRIDTLPMRLLYPRRWGNISSQWLPDGMIRRIHAYAPDLVHLHWTLDAFLAVESIPKIRLPLVWTLHDAWPFTGGCHYTLGCERYRQSCGACPHLQSTNERDLTRWNWRRKAKAWPQLRGIFVSPSRWLSEMAKQSSLLQHHRMEVIPNGVDPTFYRPYDRREARAKLGLPLEGVILLFVSLVLDAPTKGLDLLLEALRRLGSQGKMGGLRLVLVGSPPSTPFSSPPLPVHLLGPIEDEEKMALVYAASDLFVAPSRIDNFPNTVLEAMSCGVPTIAFAVGGLPEMIEDGVTGRILPPFDIDALAVATHELGNDRERREAMSQAARKRIEGFFSLASQAKAYLRLYSQLLALPFRGEVGVE